MRTSAVTARLAQSEELAALVLEAERAALSEIEQFKRQTLRLVVTSWLRAVLVHKRTQARIKRLRERMTAKAQLRQARISCEMQALAGDIGEEASVLAALESAIARVTEELVGTSELS